MAPLEHALVSIHDDHATCTIYRHNHGEPWGPLGVLATMGQAYDDALRFVAQDFADALVGVWQSQGDYACDSDEPIALYDPRWWYEVDCIRDRICVTVHDLFTPRAEPQTFPINH